MGLGEKRGPLCDDVMALLQRHGVANIDHDDAVSAAYLILKNVFRDRWAKAYAAFWTFRDTLED